MRRMKLGRSNLEVPVIAVGCEHIVRLNQKEAEVFVETALERGANFFDNADVYSNGRSEECFAAAARMSEDRREKFIIETKCGIIPDVAVDLSCKHILESVDASLKRLRTDYVDVLLMHMPDMLVDPEEVAAAWDTLYSSGKVRNFGVSNHKPSQIQLLQKYVKFPIVSNQMQLSIVHDYMISQGFYVNMSDDRAYSRDGSVLDFCRLNDITIQTWSPFRYGFFEGVFLDDNEKFPRLNKKLQELADQYGVSKTTITMAWILRHPAHMQPITGTTKSYRLEECLKAADLELTRKEWYDIYFSSGNFNPIGGLDDEVEPKVEAEV